jgi:hypothetical protein
MDGDKPFKDSSTEAADESSSAATVVEKMTTTFFNQPFTQNWFFKNSDCNDDNVVRLHSFP